MLVPEPQSDRSASRWPWRTRHGRRLDCLRCSRRAIAVLALGGQPNSISKPSFIYASRNLSTAPGSTYSKSNFGYLFGMAVVELVSGLSFLNFVLQRLLVPIGIVDVAPCPTTGPGGRTADQVQPARCLRGRRYGFIVNTRVGIADAAWNAFVHGVNATLDGWPVTPRVREPSGEHGRS